MDKKKLLLRLLAFTPSIFARHCCSAFNAYIITDVSTILQQLNETSVQAYTFTTLQGPDRAKMPCQSEGGGERNTLISCFGMQGEGWAGPT